ncbi:MAG: MBOAT family protein [Lachnospiraceae bacterium]|nr:MBOAT family protein [Lachnospiraceae bacterium]
MVFSSPVFLLMFLPIVFIGNVLIRKEYSNCFLLIASLIFYAWGEPYLVFLMIISVVLNWGIGFALGKTQGNKRRLLLIVGIACDLGILGYYKYAGFFAKTLNYIFGKEVIPVLQIALPIGISFFTFQALSYIVDVYRGETEASDNFVNVALYISFFPQLIAGPIVKYRDINKQIESRDVNWIDVSDGFKRFIYGLGKKVLIANVLGRCADTVYAFDITAMDCRTAWIGALAYTFQIYYDFSGYSDMAIGLGKMFGFKILENFEYPYLSHSITEFWRRWHISLGSWFREYVYIPLGGNRKGTGRTYLNLILVFFLTGLWHGAGISFILWGLFHGFFTIIERLGLKKILDKTKVLSVLYTFFIVNIGWVLFRAEGTVKGLRFIACMLQPWRYQDSGIETWNYIDNKTVFIFGCAVAGMGLIKKYMPVKIRSAWQNSVTEAIYCVLILMICLASLASDTYNPFIYFQF